VVHGEAGDREVDTDAEALSVAKAEQVSWSASPERSLKATAIR